MITFEEHKAVLEAINSEIAKASSWERACRAVTAYTTVALKQLEARKKGTQ